MWVASLKFDALRDKATAHNVASVHDVAQLSCDCVKMDHA